MAGGDEGTLFEFTGDDSDLSKTLKHASGELESTANKMAGSAKGMADAVSSVGAAMGANMQAAAKVVAEATDGMVDPKKTKSKLSMIERDFNNFFKMMAAGTKVPKDVIGNLTAAFNTELASAGKRVKGIWQNLVAMPADAQAAITASLGKVLGSAGRKVSGLLKAEMKSLSAAMTSTDFKLGNPNQLKAILDLLNKAQKEITEKEKARENLANRRAKILEEEAALQLKVLAAEEKGINVATAGVHTAKELSRVRDRGLSQIEAELGKRRALIQTQIAEAAREESARSSRLSAARALLELDKQQKAAGQPREYGDREDRRKAIAEIMTADGAHLRSIREAIDAKSLAARDASTANKDELDAEKAKTAEAELRARLIREINQLYKLQSANGTEERSLKYDQERLALIDALKDADKESLEYIQSEIQAEKQLAEIEKVTVDEKRKGAAEELALQRQRRSLIQEINQLSKAEKAGNASQPTWGSPQERHAIRSAVAQGQAEELEGIREIIATSKTRLAEELLAREKITKLEQENTEKYKKYQQEKREEIAKTLLEEIATNEKAGVGAVTNAERDKKAVRQVREEFEKEHKSIITVAQAVDILRSRTEGYEAGAKKTYEVVGEAQQKSLNKARQMARDINMLAGQMRIMGTIGVASFSGFLASAVNLAENFRLLAEEVGVTNEDAQKLIATFQEFGVTAQQGERSLKIFAKSLDDAQNGAGKARDKFIKLGISQADLAAAGPSLLDKLKLVSTAMGDVADPAERLARMTDLFGKGAVQLVPLLNAGGKAIEAAFGKAPAMADGMSAALINLTIQVENAKSRFMIMAGELAVKAKPVIEDTIRVFEGLSNIVHYIPSGVITAAGSMALWGGAALIGASVTANLSAVYTVLAARIAGTTIAAEAATGAVARWSTVVDMIGGKFTLWGVGIAAVVAASSWMIGVLGDEARSTAEAIQQTDAYTASLKRLEGVKNNRGEKTGEEKRREEIKATLEAMNALNPIIAKAEAEVNRLTNNNTPKALSEAKIKLVALNYQYAKLEQHVRDVRREHDLMSQHGMITNDAYLKGVKAEEDALRNRIKSGEALTSAEIRAAEEKQRKLLHLTDPSGTEKSGRIALDTKFLKIIEEKNTANLSANKKEAEEQQLHYRNMLALGKVHGEQEVVVVNDKIKKIWASREMDKQVTRTQTEATYKESLSNLSAYYEQQLKKEKEYHAEVAQLGREYLQDEKDSRMADVAAMRGEATVRFAHQELEISKQLNAQKISTGTAERELFELQQKKHAQAIAESAAEEAVRKEYYIKERALRVQDVDDAKSHLDAAYYWKKKVKNSTVADQLAADSAVREAQKDLHTAEHELKRQDMEDTKAVTASTKTQAAEGLASDKNAFDQRVRILKEYKEAVLQLDRFEKGLSDNAVDKAEMSAQAQIDSFEKIGKAALEKAEQIENGADREQAVQETTTRIIKDEADLRVSLLKSMREAYETEYGQIFDFLKKVGALSKDSLRSMQEATLSEMEAMIQMGGAAAVTTGEFQKLLATYEKVSAELNGKKKGSPFMGGTFTPGAMYDHTGKEVDGGDFMGGLTDGGDDPAAKLKDRLGGSIGDLREHMKKLGEQFAGPQSLRTETGSLTHGFRSLTNVVGELDKTFQNLTRNISGSSTNPSSSGEQPKVTTTGDPRIDAAWRARGINPAGYAVSDPPQMTQGAWNNSINQNNGPNQTVIGGAGQVHSSDPRYNAYHDQEEYRKRSTWEQYDEWQRDMNRMSPGSGRPLHTEADQPKVVHINNTYTANLNASMVSPGSGIDRSSKELMTQLQIAGPWNPNRSQNLNTIGGD